MNNKGFNTIELLITLALISFFVYLAITIPTTFMKEYKLYNQLSNEIIDENTLKKVITEDLRNFKIDKNGNKLIIGDVIYTFNDEGVYRKESNKSTKITNIKYDFNINDNVLTIYNDVNTIKYNTLFSFQRGDNIE